MNDDDAKKAILARRARFIAAAMVGAGIGVSCSNKDSTPQVCLSVAIDQDVEVACDEPGVPAVSSSAECVDEDGTVVLTLANDGEPGKNLPVTFVVTDPVDDTTQEVVVAPGESAEVTATPEGSPSRIAARAGPCDSPAVSQRNMR